MQFFAEGVTPLFEMAADVMIHLQPSYTALLPARDARPWMASAICL